MDLGLIFRKVGEDFPTLSRVCHLFNSIANMQAYCLCEILGSNYGPFCLMKAIEAKGLACKSYVGKIEGIFSAARHHLRIHTQGFPIPYYEDSSFAALGTFLLPWKDADHQAAALFKLWDYLLKTGHPSLKALMAKVEQGNNYIENVQAIRGFFETNRFELSKVSYLNLSRCELRALPPELFRYFTGLESLNLSKNFLETLPEEIGLLSELKELCLSDNDLKLLPSGIGKLSFLTHLECNSNVLESMPDEICELNRLKTLHLCCNRLQQLPQNLGNLQKLKSLSLERNCLTVLPPSIGSLRCLLGLYLCDNSLVSLPESICELQALKHLSLQCNQLMVLPENIGKMTSLQLLGLDDNQIIQFPKSLDRLEKLKYLSFSKNKISSFPEGMDSLKKLKHFCFTGNPINTFPEEIGALPFWSLHPRYYPCLKQGSLQSTLNSEISKLDFLKNYFGLGDKKWMECIDGCDQFYGENVYDEGLHGHSVEPGFLGSMRKAFEHLGSRPNQILNADFYLDLHKVTCGHFSSLGREGVGVFRDSNKALSATFREPEYLMHTEAMIEFNNLNERLSQMFGASFRLGSMEIISMAPKTVKIRYAILSQAQVSVFFNFFLTEFYKEIGHSNSNEERVEAIAKLIQRLEWLHPVADGCGRTDTALLNYLLCCYGFNPVLLKFPYVSSCMSLENWKKAVFEGMKAWRLEAEK